ncbi:CBS domain-containing protein [Bdellovibrio bacteriovorus]|uniref:CBS domain-containing protein n=1 Tax=Bdellovibrio bacteriovorus TaxID=959 RepID=A0A1Z3N5A9_BDEBC|nr:CBS domain-containing protein [Bdellovibrio bacteriovorus]ASD62670.1 CBS domain-containing protein [Bdellovibrio bacteriovorus]
MKIALKDHMTRKLITVSKDATASEALRLMTNYWIRHLPVMDEEEDYIVGMLSERDLLRSPHAETPVGKLMSSPLKTFPIEAPMKAVVDAMIEEKVSAFLITKDDEVVGIVTSEDMLVLLDQILKKDESSDAPWVLGDLFSNPLLQRTAYLVGQAGV